jgi:hypothetical protein
MTNERWGSIPAWSPRLENSWQVVIRRHGFSQPGHYAPRLTSRNFASFSNIAHLHVRSARQAGERDSQLGATITLTQPEHARLILIFGGIASPITVAGLVLPKVLLPMCCFESARR